jgi:hypothetical protein
MIKTMAMKTITALLFILFLVSGCKKSTDPNNPVDPSLNYTPVTPYTPVFTSLITYMHSNSQTNNPAQVSINGAYSNYNLQYNAFTSGVIQTDLFRTQIFERNNLTVSDLYYFHTPRVLPLTPSFQNYADATVIPRELVYSASSGADNGYFWLPAGGSVSYGPLDPANYPNGGLQGFGYAAYLNPVAKGFALSMPDFSVDSVNKRWFLRSFGSYWLDTYFPANKGVKLTIPIQPSMQSTAPDSVPAYKYENWKWVRGAMAKKINNTYQVPISTSSLWNIAMPVAGVYLKVNLRSDSAATLTNMKLVAKINDQEVATGRTNAEGSGVLFVPANEKISLYVYPDQYNYQDEYPLNKTKDIGSFPTASEVDVNIPVKTTPGLTTLYGRVFDCVGNPVQNGTALLSVSNVMPREYYVPIKNGRFTTSIYLQGGYDAVYVSILDPGGVRQGGIAELVLGSGPYAQQGKEYDLNFYTCTTSTKLYFNYTLDNKKYLLTDDASSASPFITYAAGHISSVKNGTGVDIASGTLTVGPWNWFTSPVMINGVAYQIDQSMGSYENYMSHVDAAGTGYTEGWVSIDLKDNAGALHKLSATFRLKNK